MTSKKVIPENDGAMLLSEDGDDGRTLGGVTLVNPFASPRSPLLLEAQGKRPFRTR